MLKKIIITFSFSKEHMTHYVIGMSHESSLLWLGDYKYVK